MQNLEAEQRKADHGFTPEEVITELRSATEWLADHGKNTNAAGIIVICNHAIDTIGALQRALQEEKADCKKWYHEYHGVKDDLEYEREYLRSEQKLSDKYFRELMFSKEALGGLENSLMGLSEIVNEVRKIAGGADSAAGASPRPTDSAAGASPRPTDREAAREILSEIREAYEKYGGAYGMLQKLEELEVRYGVRERDCCDCPFFVGCEAVRGGLGCDLINAEVNAKC